MIEAGGVKIERRSWPNGNVTLDFTNPSRVFVQYKKEELRAIGEGDLRKGINLVALAMKFVDMSIESRPFNTFLEESK